VPLEGDFVCYPYFTLGSWIVDEYACNFDVWN